MGRLEILRQGIANESVDLAMGEVIEVAVYELAGTTMKAAERGKESGRTDKKSGSSRPEVGYVLARVQPVKHSRSEQEVGKSAVSEKY